MTDRDYSVAEQQRFFSRVMEWALLSRAYVLVQAIYFIVISFGFEGPDRHMFQMEALPTGPAFFVAGMFGLLILFFPGSRTVLVLWLLAVGLACVGRQFSILMMPRELLPGEWSSAQIFSFRVRAMGWGLQVLGAIVAITQIIAAAALRGRRVWTG